MDLFLSSAGRGSFGCLKGTEPNSGPVQPPLDRCQNGNGPPYGGLSTAFTDFVSVTGHFVARTLRLFYPGRSEDFTPQDHFPNLVSLMLYLERVGLHDQSKDRTGTLAPTSAPETQVIILTEGTPSENTPVKGGLEICSLGGHS